MSTTLLDNRKSKDLQPATELWSLFQPEKAAHRFRARSRAAAGKWQGSTRKALVKTIGFQSPSQGHVKAPRKVEAVDRGDYIREKILLRTSANGVMPVFLLLPKDVSEPPPVVVAFHGHGYGVKDIVGLWESGAERDTPDGYHKDFGIELCRRGFAVAAPEISCFGERQSDYSNLDFGAPIPTTCTHSAMLAFHLGTSVVGLRVRDGRCLIDYLETRADMNAKSLGAMGISGGGMHTFFSTCVDRRIKACVVSGYYSSFKDSILAMNHCACNFVPGLHEFGEMCDLVGLIAPRPLLVEAGDHDPIFPQRSVKKAVATAREVYRVFGAESELEADFFEGRHQISGRRAYDFLREKLSA